MGFKWFKARIRMNRMPAHSSAVAGSYKTTTFDSPTREYISNNDQKDNGHVEPEPRLSTRPISMPNLNNPMVEIANGDDSIEFVPPSDNVTARSLSTRTLDSSEYDEEKMYGGLGIGTPISLAKRKILQNDFGDIIETRRPTPVPKMQTANRKKKAKAPMPKSKSSTMNANARASENGGMEFVTLTENRENSRDSDIEV